MKRTVDKSKFCSNAVHYHACEVLQLDVVIVNELTVSDYLLNFLLTHSLAHVDHRVSELLHGDFAIFVSIKDSKSIHDIL